MHHCLDILRFSQFCQNNNRELITSEEVSIHLSGNIVELLILMHNSDIVVVDVAPFVVKQHLQRQLFLISEPCQVTRLLTSVNTNLLVAAHTVDQVGPDLFSGLFLDLDRVSHIKFQFAKVGDDVNQDARVLEVDIGFTVEILHERILFVFLGNVTLVLYLFESNLFP